MTFYRRNLPHWHPEGKSIFITWRLYGSLPASMLKRIRTAKIDRSTNPAEADSEESPGRIFRQLDATLDSARSGPLWLADPEFAAYAEYPILRGAELGRYVLHAYVVMPNHVHVLLDAHLPLAKISGVIKGVAARDINGSLGRSGKPLWQDESFAEILAFGLSACTQPGAATFALKATGFDFSRASSPAPRLRTFPPHQFDLDPAVQGMRNADQRPNRQIARLILHRRNLRCAHLRKRRQFCLAQLFLRPQLRDLHSHLQVLQLSLHKLPHLRVFHLFPIKLVPSRRHFFFPSIRRPCNSMRASAMRMSSSGSLALRFTMPCSKTNTLLASPKYRILSLSFPCCVRSSLNLPRTCEE